MKTVATKRANASSASIGRKRPTPRAGIYELYWQFASRRQAAFEKRLTGAPQPWTDDPILQTYKFCNVYRAADRVSQYMIQRVIYEQAAGSVSDRIFRIVAFRTFSNVRTWEGLTQALGEFPTLSHLRSGAFENALDTVKGREGRLYTGAFILCANKAFGYQEKHRNHVALFKLMFLEKELGERMLGANSLEGIVKQLEAFPLIGPFMAYQTAIDLNYSDLFEFSENDYTQAGPGAVRGLRKVFVDLGDYSAADAIRWMVDNQKSEFSRLRLPFSGLFGRALHAIDCQGLFCEVDKYCREAAPQLASNRSRIKARFAPAHAPPELFFPPKWGLEIPVMNSKPKSVDGGQYQLFSEDLVRVEVIPSLRR